MKKYAQLARLHTTPLEAVPAVVGLLLVDSNPGWVAVLAWLAWGATYHIVGYSMNSYEDWVNGYDKQDPYKQHHPLADGRLGETQAKVFTYSMLVAYAVVTTWLAFSAGGWLLIPLVAIQAAGGMLYNYIGKKSVLKFGLISVAHTMVFVMPFVFMGGDVVSLEFIFGATFVFIWVVYQISVSGEIKDIRTDEANFLKRLGVEVIEPTEKIDGVPSHTPRIIKKNKAVKWATYLTVAKIAIAFMFTLEFSGLGVNEMFFSLCLVAACVVLWYLNSNMVRYNRYHRPTKIVEMSMIELVTLSMFCLMVYPVVGVASVFIIVCSVLWVVVGNRWLWGTDIAPKV